MIYNVALRMQLNMKAFRELKFGQQEILNFLSIFVTKKPCIPPMDGRHTECTSIRMHTRHTLLSEKKFYR